MRVSLVCVTGSTELNSRLRAELLWRMVNSAHLNPGHPFELILVDNSQGGAHRKAIRDIFDSYRSVTHIVQNRINEFHGGGVRQGLQLADGDMLVQITDDLELKPGWLSALIHPLLIYPEEKFVGGLVKGHNVRAPVIRRFDLEGIKYVVRPKCAAYCWAYSRKTYKEMGDWRRAHFADTRFSKRLQRAGYVFTLPEERYADETNLNYLRPWDYKNERGIHAQQLKHQHLDHVWPTGVCASLLHPPVVPTTEHPLKNPEGIGPGAYPEDWLAEQEIAGDS